MTTFHIPLQTWASTSIEYVPDAETLALYEETGDKTVIVNAFWDTNPDLPSICAQCAGWGNTQNLDLGDEWEISEYKGEYDIEADD